MRRTYLAEKILDMEVVHVSIVVKGYPLIWRKTDDFRYSRVH
jgi:hypothetical protein